MFSLCFGLYKQWTAQTTYSVLILGLDNAGKTTFFEQLKKVAALSTAASGSGESKQSVGGSMRRPHTMPTIGLNVNKLTCAGNVALQLWDLGGQAGLRPLWEHYFSEAHALVFVLDAGDEDRLAETREELERLLKEHALDDCPLLILANKQDTANVLPQAKVLRALDITGSLRLRDLTFPSSSSTSLSTSSSSSSSSTASSSSASAQSQVGSSISMVAPSPSSSSSSASLSQQSSSGSASLSGTIVAPQLGGSSSSSSSPVSSSSLSSSCASSPPCPHVTVVTTSSSGRLVRYQPASSVDGRGLSEALTWLLTVIPPHPRTARLTENASLANLAD